MAHRLRLHPADALPRSWVVVAAARPSVWVVVLLCLACERPADIVAHILASEPNQPLADASPPRPPPVVPPPATVKVDAAPPPPPSASHDAGNVDVPLPLNAGGHAIGAQGDTLLLDGVPVSLFGVRAASALMDQGATDALLAQLDTYRLHGVNAVSVSLQGGEALSHDPFTPSGNALDPAYLARVLRVVEALDVRSMVAIVGMFSPDVTDVSLTDWDSAEAALSGVTKALRSYRNVILNTADKQDSPNHKGKPWARVNSPAQVQHLAQIMRRLDPDRLVGGGGTNYAANLELGTLSDVDVLLFSGGDLAKGAQELKAAGVAKPMICVELYGSWTEQFLPPGVFPEAVKQRYFDDLDAALSVGALSVFFYSAPWLEGPSVGAFPIRFDLGGQGTEADPGIRWYFERLRARR